ncbi:type IV toxin-antitoxin system AbiEi family antitoxin [Tessaracoccus caeni]|uniref:type IV toxin-antitoxin system AbiEi family antitoxin n=1 Tax=Tessaracoccus caeni TaxID=3031239 RepID=UPI0023DC77EB|nr:type IV toxin-antitoxin system AbiEi family antitoxin [Tessaracoccus caeni]MDF1487195.1 type IV toxin-antitoxin system AbiEi family antitoxin [Tessaracoccus caeni]
MSLLNTRVDELVGKVQHALSQRDIEAEFDLPPEATHPEAHGLARVRIDDIAIDMPLEVRAQLRPSTVDLLRPNLTPNTLVVSDHITTTVGDLLRRKGLNYADAAGNAFITGQGLRIHFEGFRPIHTDRQPSRLFTKASLPVLLAVLTRPALIHAPVRELQSHTMASVGTTHRVRRQLLTSGLERTPQEDPSANNRRRWRSLFEGWVAEFTTARESLILGRYTSEFAVRTLPERLAEIPVVLSGELAAFARGADIRPATADLYLDAPNPELLRAARLRRDPHGPISLRQAIWTSALEDITAGLPVLAPSPVVYADIASILDPRTDTVARNWLTNDPILRSIFDD